MKTHTYETHDMRPSETRRRRDERKRPPAKPKTRQADADRRQKKR